MRRIGLIATASLLIVVFAMACSTASTVIDNPPTPTDTGGNQQGTPMDTGGNQQGKPLALPKGTPQRPVGAQAITPTKPGAVPAFTQGDVIQYGQKYPLLNTTPPGAKVTVLGVLFTTSKDVSALLQNEPTGLPSDYPLCFVELQGAFQFSGPAPSSGQKAITYPYAFEVFDSTTGNVLLLGGLSSPIKR